MGRRPGEHGRDALDAGPPLARQRIAAIQWRHRLF
jgi:hypothetical protein